MGYEDKIRRYIESLGATSTYLLPAGMGEVVGILPYIPCITLLILRTEAQIKYNDLLMSAPRRAKDERFKEALSRAAEAVTELTKAYASYCIK